MNRSRDKSSRKVLELFAEESEAALGLLADDDELLKAFPDDLPESEKLKLLEVAGLTQLSFLRIDPDSYEELPDTVRGKVLEKAHEFVQQSADRSARSRQPLESGEQAPEEARRKKSPVNTVSAAGWLLAAAAAIAFVVFRTDVEVVDDGRPVAAIEPASSQRLQLLNSAADAITVPWSESAEAGYESASGDVVWSAQNQAGFLRIAGIPANDPGLGQYQLWIIDPDRDQNPIDGGVFDVPAGAGEVVIAIDAKLPVGSARAFAITLEKPGGVVVSDGPLLLVAPITT